MQPWQPKQSLIHVNNPSAQVGRLFLLFHTNKINSKKAQNHVRLRPVRARSLAPPLRCVSLNPSLPPIPEGRAAPTMTGLLSCFSVRRQIPAVFCRLPHIRSLSVRAVDATWYGGDEGTRLCRLGFVLSWVVPVQTHQRQDDKDSAFDWKFRSAEAGLFRQNPKSAIMKKCCCSRIWRSN